MKGAAIILICAISHIVGDEFNDDPSKASAICATEESDGVLVAHEHCNQFYKCAAGVPVALLCPSNLLYNPAKKFCDWPEHVDCGNRTIPDEDTANNVNPDDDTNGNDSASAEDHSDEVNDDPSQAPTICASKDSDGVLVAHEYCKKFYKCAAGVPVALLCPSNLLYNPAKKFCDWPEHVDCGNRTIPDEDTANDGNSDEDNNGNNSASAEDPSDEVNDDPSQAPTICASKDSDGVLVAHEHCNKFYKCAAGVPVIFTCQPRLLYSPNRKWCDWPQNVKCGSRIIPDEDSGSDNNPDSDDNNINDNENEGPDKPNEEINDDPSQASTICATEESDGVLVAHEHCNKFYKCAAGVPVALLCPSNLLYNPAKKFCDWPEHVDCGNRTIPDEDTANDVNSGEDTNGNDFASVEDPSGEVNDDPSQASTICASEGSDGVLVAHGHCNKFYKCAAGVPVALLCPSNLRYNPKKKWCDWPEQVNCGNRTIPDEDTSNDDNSSDDNNENDSASAEDPSDEENDDPSLAPTICASQDSDGVLVAHEHCNKFYKCAAGVPVIFTCQPRLLYSPNKKWCDWPENVNCGSRIIPDEDSGSDPGSDDNNINDNENEGSDEPSEEINDDPSQALSLCATEESDGVLVAHEQCNKFFKCAAGVPVALLCPSNLLYNPAKKLCDWPEHVDCGNRTIPDEDTANDGNSGEDNNENDSASAEDPSGEVNDDPSQAPTVCASEDSDGVLIAHEYCNKFYKCAAGVPVALLCPSNLLYNPKKQWCDWPEHVNCGNRTIPDEDTSNDDNSSEDNNGNDSASVEDPSDEVNDDPSLAPTICASQDSDGVLVAHEHCNKFYKCAAGVPVALLCPSNLLYNPTKKWCDWPEHVDCGNRTIPDEDTSNDDNSSEDNNGNDSASAEDPSDEVNDDPSLAPTICASQDSDGVLVAHEHCNKFYKCAAGVPVIFTCQPRLLYSSNKKWCDWPENVNCGSRIIPDEDSGSDNDPGSDDNNINDNENEGSDEPSEEINDDPSQVLTLCATEESDGVLVAHEQCNKFFKCAAGVPVALLCPSNLLYNPAKKLCDWPEHVDCGNRTIPDEDTANDGNSGEDNNENDSVSAEDPSGEVNDDPSQAPTICAGHNSDGVLVAHEHCNRFYKCSGGLPIEFNCQPGLFYNPNKKWCDWPVNVKCGNRILPESLIPL